MKTTFLTTYRKAQNPEQTHFCPGCGHGNLLKFVDESICCMDMAERTIWVSPVGCGGLTDSYLSISHVLSPHGRASAVATAVKRLNPDALVIVSQGDGDLASIGFLEALHAANRGENITVFFMNNANFAMTGGQMAPTTLIGQRTTTSPMGRMMQEHGAPLKVCEILDQLEGPAFIARVAFGTEKQIAEAQRIIRRAIENQLQGKGYSFVEILTPCPSNWHCSPVEARDRVATEMTKTFPLGILRDETRENLIQTRLRPQTYTAESVIQAYEELAKPVSIREAGILTLTKPTAVCCAGFGGQGVLTLGKWIARLALASNLESTWIPSYGPEMRGGVANCFVRIDSAKISSPVVECPDVIFAMNQPALETFLPRRAPGAILFYDADMASLPDDPDIPDRDLIIPVHASSIAQSKGAPKSANLVMLKAWLQHIHTDLDKASRILGIPWI